MPVLRKTLTTAALALLVATPALSEQGPPPTIAIIIDDMGVHKGMEERLIQLDQPLTLAFLPYRRYTRHLAQTGHEQGKEIMLHAPMANNASMGLGAGGLDMGMDQAEMARILRQSLAVIPNVSGVNNHMGSLLTSHEESMNWVMDELAQHDLYFVDSRTIASTVAADVAESRNIPTLSRDVFLDHELTPEYVDAQFQLLLKKAREEGTAIAIGHPHEVTVEYLEKMLPKLDEMGYAIATVSAVWSMRNGNHVMFEGAEGEVPRVAQYEVDDQE